MVAFVCESVDALYSLQSICQHQYAHLNHMISTGTDFAEYFINYINCRVPTDSIQFVIIIYAHFSLPLSHIPSWMLQSVVRDYE